MTRWPTWLLVGEFVGGMVLWFSDLVFNESNLVHTLVGGLGLFVSIMAFLYFGRRRGWFSRA